MSDERKHIDNYFSEALEGHEEEGLDVGLSWKGIEPNLGKWSFFRFSANRFNIYYFSVISVSVALSVALIVKHYQGKDQLKWNQQLEQTTDSLSFSESSAAPSSSHHADNKSPAANQRDQKRRKEIVKEELSVSPEVKQTPSVDTSHILSTEVVPATPVSPLEVQKRADSVASKKIKPPIVINRKRDTIHKVDTVFTDKRKKRNK